MPLVSFFPIGFLKSNRLETQLNKRSSLQRLVLPYPDLHQHPLKSKKGAPRPPTQNQVKGSSKTTLFSLLLRCSMNHLRVRATRKTYIRLLSVKNEVNIMTVRIRYPERNTKAPIVTIGKLELYFSYETIIAFDSPIIGFWIIKNYWSKTTGRHLNEINPDHSVRSDHNLFEDRLNAALRAHNLE